MFYIELFKLIFLYCTFLYAQCTLEQNSSLGVAITTSIIVIVPSN